MADQPDIAALRDRITGLVAQNAVAMVQCAIDAVHEEGQYQAIEYPFEMVGPEKQRRLRRAAEAWLAGHPELERLELTFDVVAVRGGRLERLQDAL